MNNSRSVRVLLNTAICLAILASAPKAYAATACGMIDLDIAPGRVAEANDLNDTGVIVGQSTYGAFVWDRGAVSYLPVLNGYQSTYVKAINNPGLMVGVARNVTVAGSTHAVRWRNFVARDLGAPGGEFSTAEDINDKGEVVGGSYTASGEMHAFLWKNGVMTDLATILGPGYSFAYAINGKGHVVGFQLGDSGNRGFLIQDGTVMYLTGLKPQSTTPRDINDNGQIVGSFISPKGHQRAFLWQNGLMRGLGTLGGTTNSAATAINANGLVTGWAAIAPTNHTHAFLWQNGVMKDLGIFGRNS